MEYGSYKNKTVPDGMGERNDTIALEEDNTRHICYSS